MNTSTPPIDRLLNIKEVCEILSRSPASIYRDITRGDFPSPLKLHGSSRWRLSAVNAIVENGMAQND
ncbi:helix-turn-helix transcriptional regulator [Cohaesibacter celericrescens]|uniref:helix-turn-helix transcriptional regulator n=1 Tax=Cohaesibacter celericrescens TaxID=2067669 RepID=UPI003561F88C